MANEPTKDEISLKDLVGEVNSGAVSPSADKSSSPADEASLKPSLAGIEIDPASVQDVERLLSEEDPEFANSMAEIKKLGAQVPTAAEIDSLDLETLSAVKPPGRLKQMLFWIIRRNGKSDGLLSHTFDFIMSLPFRILAGLKVGLVFAKSAATVALRILRGAVNDFFALPTKSKLILFLAIGFGALAFMTVKWTLGGKMNLRVGNSFLRSFGEIADASFKYEPDEPIDDFTDPLFHPEHVIMLDKFVINLRRPQDGSNPMGLFEFYFEASNQDCAVEIKDRQGEARDVISRALEQMSYNDLITVEGKEKLKLILRKSVNAILTRGQVRRVFLKTIILKP